MLKTAAITLLLALGVRAQVPAARVAQVPVFDAIRSLTARSASADSVTQLIPLNAAANELLTPMFAWRKSAAADSYELQISTRADFSTLERSLTGLTDTIYVLTGDLQPSTTYYWRVRGRNAAGALTYSSVWSFVTVPPPPLPPFPIGPTSGSENLSIPVTFSWQQSALATHYQVQIFSDVYLQSKVFDTLFLHGETALVFARLTYARTYYWQVSAGNQGGRSAFYGPMEFTTLQKPAYVSLRTPGTGTISVPVAVNLTWATTPLAAAYVVQFSTDRDFTTLVLDTTVTDTLFPARLDNATQYYWRVSAVNAAGSSPFSTSEFKTVALLGPGVPILASPADSGDGLSLSPALKWHPAKLAAVYKVQVSQAATFGVLDYQDSAADTSETVGPLKDGQLYYWRVQSLNAAGVSGFSDIHSFRTGSVVAMASRKGPVRASVSFTLEGSGTMLEFSVPESESVRISLIEPGTGQIRDLVNGRYAAGIYRLPAGRQAGASGVFILRITMGSYREVRLVAQP